MALETVTIHVLTDDLSPVPVDGVSLRIYDSTGTTLITSGVSGAVTTGVLEVTLPGGSPTPYQLRSYKAGVSIVSPQYLDVYSPPVDAPSGTNIFSVEAHVLGVSEATDSLLCRCSGFVRGPDGSARPGIDISFIPLFRPLVAGGSAVLGERVTVQTDAAGYVSIDLFRTGIYYATVESHDNTPREVVVPDRSSLNIAYLLFPVVAAITYDVALALATGTDLEVVPTVRCTNFQALDGVADADVSYSTDDPAIASINVLSDRIVVHGISPGTTTLRVTRTDNSVVYLPDPGLSGDETPVVVS